MGNKKKRTQYPCKPGSVPPQPHGCTTVPAIYLRRKSLYGSSVPPSVVASIGRTALRRRFTRTCSLQMAQPDSHLPAGSLLHYLLTLTYNECRRLFSSAISYRHRQLPFSEVECPVLPGLSSRTCMMPAADRGTVFIKSEMPRRRMPALRYISPSRLIIVQR